MADRVQGKQNANRGDEVFGGKLVGIQLADSGQSSTLFTLGNFNITTNLISNQDKIFKLPDFDRVLTAKDIVNGGIEDVKKLMSGNQVEINYNKTKLENFIEYGASVDGFRNALTEIIQKFPAALTVKKSIDNSIRNYNYDSLENIATFTLSPVNILNPFNIIYNASGTNATISEYISKYRNFSKEFENYSIKTNGFEYEIFNVSLPPDGSTNFNFQISVIGDPFVTTTGGTANEEFYISPLNDLIDEEINNLSDLAYYLLNWKGENRYTTKFVIPVEDNNNNLVNESRYLTFPLVDGYNIDVTTDSYEDYTTELFEIAEDLDSAKTNLINRFYTASVLKEYDTEDRKVNTILQLTGQNFDGLKKYINGILHMRKVSYDKIDNVPDLLIKNFAHLLGWETFEIEDEDTLVQSLFDFNNTQEVDENDITPQELDIELWRRLVINSFYLFKSKGTRKSIEMVLKMVGIPRDVVEITENVYVAQNKLDYQQIRTKVSDINQHPIDENGYPTTPQLYFQANGGYFIQDRNNLGPYDYGQSYVDQYKRFNDTYAFDIYQVSDNKKSWVKSNITTNLSDDNTNYTVDNTDLIINSKELDIFLSSSRVFDVSVYRYFANNNIDIDTNLHTGFTTTIKPNNLTFYNYLKKVTTQIDPKNRKVIRAYPKLSKLYYQYLVETEGLDTGYITYSKSLGFLSKFDNYWIKLITQFVPSTAILTTGKKIQNSALVDNKYKYKHGKNDDIEWLGTDGSEFQNKAKLDVWTGEAKRGDIVTIVTKTKVFESTPVGATVLYNEPVSGFLDRKAKYTAYYYGFFDFCDYKSNSLDERHGDFGTFTSILPNDPYIDDTTLGLETYIQPTDTLNTVYGYAYNTAPAGLAGSVTSTSVDTTNTLSGASFKVVSRLSTGVYDYNIHLGLSNVSVENGVDYEITFTYKYFSDGIKYDFYIYNDNGSEVSSGRTDLGDGWFEVNKVVTPSAGSMNIKLISDRVYDFTTVCIDSVVVRQYTNQGFEEAYDVIGTDFFCPPPLPHVCYLPFKDGVTGSDAITKIVNTQDAVNNFKYPTDWDLVNIIPPVDPITYLNLTGTASLPSNLNGLLINNPYVSNIGAKQLLIYNGSGSIITKNSSTGKDVYFESLLITSNQTVAKITPVLVDSNNHTESGITVTYPYTWTSGSFVPTILDGGIRGTFFNNEIPNGSYHFGVLIEHNVTSSFKFRNFRLGVKHVYGDGVSNFTVNQLYGEYNTHEDLNTDFYPLMHVKGSYITKKDVDTNDEFVELNLRNTHNLRYVFFNPDNINESVLSIDGAIDNQTFLSDSVTFDVEGIYPTKTILENGVQLGPFYNIKSNIYTDNLGVESENEVWSLYGEINNTYNCLRGQTTNLGIINPFTNVTGSTFINNSNDITFVSQADSNYFKMNGNTRIKFDLSLIFESDFTIEQEVIIKLVNEFGTSYVEESFVFAGSDNANYVNIDDRTAEITFTLQLGLDDKVYLAVEPVDADCRVLQSEDLVVNDYNFNIINPKEISSLGNTSGSLSDKYNNISFVQTLSGDTFNSIITDNTLIMDEYTRIKVELTEKPTEFIPSEYKTISGYLLSVGKNYDELGKTGWANDTTEFYISKEPINRMDFYPYVPNNTHAPLDRDWTSGQSILDAVQSYQQPVFSGYEYNNVATYGSGTTLVSGNTLSGNTITLTKHSAIKVYESVVSGMSDTLMTSLDFYDSDLMVKDKLKDQRMDSNYFRTYYNQLANLGVELVNQGSIGFETTLNGVKLKYFFEKDYAGYPKTGEYIAKINMSDVCNNSIETYIVFLIDSDYINESNVFINATSQIQRNANNLISSSVSKSTPNNASTVIDNSLEKNTTNYTLTIQISSVNGGFVETEWFGYLDGSKDLSPSLNNGDNYYDQTFTIPPNSQITFKAIVDNRQNASRIIKFNANGEAFGGSPASNNEITTNTGTINITQDYIIEIVVEGDK